MTFLIVLGFIFLMIVVALIGAGLTIIVEFGGPILCILAIMFVIKYLKKHVFGPDEIKDIDEGK